MSLARSVASGVSSATRKRTVADVMTTAVVTAYLDAPMKEIAAAMARNRINSVPVISGNRAVVGVVTASDLLDRLCRDRGPRRHRLIPHRTADRKAKAVTARGLMSWPPVTVTPRTPIHEAARLATSKQVHFMPVVEDGALVGCVTRSDLNKVYIRPDDEIRGEIEHRVVRETMLIESPTLGVDVTEGVVSIAGMLDTRDQGAQLVECVRLVPGVIEVRTHFSYREDAGDR
jgi:CBS domain-containing protein